MRAEGMRREPVFCFMPAAEALTACTVYVLWAPPSLPLRDKWSMRVRRA